MTSLLVQKKPCSVSVANCLRSGSFSHVREMKPLGVAPCRCQGYAKGRRLPTGDGLPASRRVENIFVVDTPSVFTKAELIDGSGIAVAELFKTQPRLKAVCREKSAGSGKFQPCSLDEAEDRSRPAPGCRSAGGGGQHGAHMVKSLKLTTPRLNSGSPHWLDTCPASVQLVSSAFEFPSPRNLASARGQGAPPSAP